MGSFKSIVYNPQEKRTILIIGLPRSGKTSLLYYFKFNEKIITIPTVGYNLESFSFKNKQYSAYDFQYSDDLGKFEKISELIASVNVIIFVVDICNYSSLDQSKKYLFDVVNRSEFKSKPIFIMANKSDKKEKLSTSDIADRLNLYDMKDREWFIRESSALTGEGIKESLDWINKF